MSTLKTLAAVVLAATLPAMAQAATCYTRAEAEAVMADCENRGRRGLACYKCEYCGGWHLTSHPWK